jgi:2,5-diamino-6-(ribosylamino)-4(3H)-pyrimidinone 5'-phosphate reductase
MNMVPRVILHIATSLNGRITNFPADLDLYYSLAATWNPDAILFGSETVLAAFRENPLLEVPQEHVEMFTPPEDAEDTRPLLVIAGSRGKVRCWDAIRTWPYMRDVLAFCSDKTPKEYLDFLGERKINAIIAGSDWIDMRTALSELNRQYGTKTVRVDSGGTLNSVLLKAGVVDEVSVLVHPFLSGGRADPTMFDPEKAGIPDLQVPLQLIRSEVVGDGVIWARYSVKRSG